MANDSIIFVPLAEYDAGMLPDGQLSLTLTRIDRRKLRMRMSPEQAIELGRGLLEAAEQIRARKPRLQ